MKVALGADHGGFAMKEEIKKYLETKGYELLDLGTYSEESVDYPEYGKKAAEAVTSGEADKAIVFCGTGIGVSIAANKVKGIRCALCTNSFMAKMTAKHNNANALALGGRNLGIELAKDIVDTWLDTEFEGGRHERRTKMLDEMC